MHRCAVFEPVSYTHLLLDLVFLIVFNVVFFVAGGTDHPASVWISYGFIHLAYIMLLITPFLIRKSTNTAVLGFPLYSISSAYFIVAFIVGLIFIFTHPESYKAALIVQVIIAGIYAVMLISHMIANESTGNALRGAVVCFYLSNEGVSLLENAAHLGLPIPEKMKSILAQLHNRIDDTTTDQGGGA